MMLIVRKYTLNDQVGRSTITTKIVVLQNDVI